VNALAKLENATRLDVKIDYEFSTLNRPLWPDEDVAMEADIAGYGIRDALLVWEEEDILIDGHNRWRIAKKRGIKPEHIPIRRISFPNRDAALREAIRIQMARRNITPEEFNDLMAREYLLEKKAQGGDRKSKSHFATLIGDTAKRIGEKHGKHRATVIRAAELVEAKDFVCEQVPALAPMVKTGLMPKNQVIAMAEDLKVDPSRAELYVEKFKEAAQKPKSDLPRKRTSEEEAEHRREGRRAEVRQAEAMVLDGMYLLEKFGKERREEFWFRSQVAREAHGKILLKDLKSIGRWIHESYPEHQVRITIGGEDIQGEGA
jgi:hypothetical protein